jgi:hypothetical protein
MAELVDRAEDRELQARSPRRLRDFFTRGSYELVLVMIVVTYVLAATLSGRWGATLLLFGQMGAVWLALRTSRARRGLRVMATGLFALSGIVAVVSLFLPDTTSLLALVFMAASFLYFVAPFSIVRHIGYRQTVDRETMLGALAAYLFLGMAFAFAYRVVAAMQPGPFFGAGGEGTLGDDLFFSFVTLTTTGYGNLVPADNPGQSMAVLEALVGQLFLVTAVAKIVSAWRPRVWRQPRPDAGNPRDTEPS